MQQPFIIDFMFCIILFMFYIREGALCELLYADDLVLMSETIEGVKNKFLQ